MSTTTGNQVQAAYIGYAKTQSALIALLPGGLPTEIRELEWQGTTFTYPNVRVSVDFFPPTNGCQPMAEVYFDVNSEEKSSNEASTIAGVIQNIFHRKPFTFNNIKSFSVIVTKVSKPTRSIYGWQSQIQIRSLLA